MYRDFEALGYLPLGPPLTVPGNAREGEVHAGLKGQDSLLVKERVLSKVLNKRDKKTMK